MKKKIITYFLNGLAFISGHCTCAQQAAEEFGKIKAAYNDTELSFDVAYRSFVNYTAVNPIDEIKGKYILFKGGYYQQTQDFIVFTDGELLIHINPEMNTIMVSDYVSGNSISPLPFDVQGYVNARTSIATLKSGSRRLTVALQGLDMEYEKVAIVYDTTNFLIKKVSIYYADPMILDDEQKLPEGKPKLEIVFTASNNLNKKELLKNIYFTQQGDQLKPTKEYMNYELIDNRSKAYSIK